MKFLCPSCESTIVPVPTEWSDAEYNTTTEVAAKAWFRRNPVKCPHCGAAGSEDDFPEMD